MRYHVRKIRPPARTKSVWNDCDQRGTALAAGVYLVRLHWQTRRLLLLK